MTRAQYIVLIGPDGCGKTTVADQLAAYLARHYPIRRLNFLFGNLPSLSSLLRRKPRPETIVGQRDVGMVEPLGVLKGLVLAVWYGLDHVLGHVSLRRVPEGEILIFARSYHDFLYQRAYVNIPSCVPKLFLLLGPKPLLVATPIREPAEIYVMKPELTAAEIRDQYGRITTRLRTHPYFIAVDASTGVNDVVDKLLTVLQERFRLRSDPLT